MNTNMQPFLDFLCDSNTFSADFRGSDRSVPLGDRRDGKYYRYTSELKLAIRVALAVGRPLLLMGPSGSGKSSLVFNLARLMGRRYYEFVVQARTQAQDLFYRFDAVRRLGEAQLGTGSSSNWRSCYPFVEPGPLWWVYAPETARRRGAPISMTDIAPATDPGRWPPDYLRPSRRNSTSSSQEAAAVLLIDEIDKADPDFPNNLLVPLGSGEFQIEETGDLIMLADDAVVAAPLIVITSNRERELPEAFVRRCIVLEIKAASREELVEIAVEAFADDGLLTRQRLGAIADKLIELRGADRVSTAEYLDVVKAIQSMQAEDRQWEEIILRTTWSASDQLTS